MALKEIIVETQASLRADAANARAVFSVDSEQVENLRSEVRIRQFSLTVDEPPTLGGSDAGPNPVELVLAALATCQEITYRAYATALGVPLDSVSVKLDGVLDLRGFFAVDERVRSGFTGVQGTVTLKSSATQEELAKLKAVVDAHCPVLDILRAPVPVQLASPITTIVWVLIKRLPRPHYGLSPIFRRWSASNLWIRSQMASA